MKNYGNCRLIIKIMDIRPFEERHNLSEDCYSFVHDLRMVS